MPKIGQPTDLSEEDFNMVFDDSYDDFSGPTQQINATMFTRHSVPTCPRHATVKTPSLRWKECCCQICRGDSDCNF